MTISNEAGAIAFEANPLIAAGLTVAIGPVKVSSYFASRKLHVNRFQFGRRDELIVAITRSFIQLRFYPDTLAVNGIFRDPAVDPSPIVSDLETFSLFRFYQVKVLISFDLAEHNVTNLK